MSRIEDAKRTFGSAIEDELDELARDVHDIITRARKAGDDTARLNKLASAFNGLASTLEHAATQVEDTREEVRTWLGTTKEPITEHTNLKLLAEIQREHSA